MYDCIPQTLRVTQGGQSVSVWAGEPAFDVRDRISHLDRRIRRLFLGYVDMFPPFGLCAITNLLTIIALFTNCRKIIEVTLYWGLCGAFFSIIFVDISYMPPHFRFFHYFLVHFGFALGGLYFVITGKIHPTRKGVNRSCMILLVHSLGIYALDTMFDKNWLYMRASAISGLPGFLSGPLYTVLWMLLIAGMINLWYGILKLASRLNGRMASHRAPIQIP